MLITRYRPRNRFSDLRREFDRLNALFEDMEFPTTEVERKYDFTPAVNTREGEYAYHVEVDLPGVKKEDIKVDIEKDKVTISGEKKLKEELKEEDYYKVESYYGKFKRSFSLPDNVDTENIKASSEDGVLEVVIPKLEKKEVEKTKRISVE
jgi:HSP20 family protein